jgi:hypothetical protein
MDRTVDAVDRDHAGDDGLRVSPSPTTRLKVTCPGCGKVRTITRHTQQQRMRAGVWTGRCLTCGRQATKAGICWERM